jgi:hypothetical protein
MSGSAECRNQPPRGERAQRPLLIGPATRSPERERKTRAFLLTKTYMDAGHPAAVCRQAGFEVPIATPAPDIFFLTSFSCQV